MLLISAAIVVLSGNVASYVGEALGLGDAAITAWSILKWPLLLVIASTILAVMYWAAPNVRPASFKWVSPGGIFSVIVWVIASLGFAFYVANFANYSKTYGALGGIIIFLVWLWISNIAILLGAEVNAELERSRAVEAGLPEDQEPFMDVRDVKKLEGEERADAERTREFLAEAERRDKD
jgi:membrane protein